MYRATPFASLAYMPPPAPEQLSRTMETLYRSESGRVLATLVRLLGDLDLAEESMHEAFAAALESWPQTGIPDKPRPWLISTARFKAIDAIRRRARFDAAQTDLVAFRLSPPFPIRFGARTNPVETPVGNPLTPLRTYPGQRRPSYPQSGCSFRFHTRLPRNIESFHLLSCVAPSS